MSERLVGDIAKTIRRYANGITSIEVLRLSKEQMTAMGILERIPDGEIKIIALGRNDKREILRTRIMEDVDHKRFLHGEDEYFDSVLEQAKQLLTSR